MISAGLANQPAPSGPPGLTWGNTNWSPPGGTPTHNIVLKPSGDLANKYFEQYMKNQASNQKFNQIMGAASYGFNNVMQAVTLGLNYSLQSKWFNLQGKIADNMLMVGMRQADIEFEKIQAAQRMQRENNTLSVRLARIQSQTAVAISSIKNKGKTDRAKLFVAMNAFKRNNYYTGQPTFDSSLMS